MADSMETLRLPMETFPCWKRIAPGDILTSGSHAFAEESYAPKPRAQSFATALFN